MLSSIQDQSSRVKYRYSADKGLVFSALILVIIGLLMVASASMVVSEHTYHAPFHFLYRQLAFLLMGIGAGLVIVKIPVRLWGKLSPILLAVGFILCILVIIPGIGKQINGAYRWLGVGGFGIQVSEIVKLIFLLYLAGYVVRQERAVKSSFIGFVKPLIVLVGYIALLLLEPDFGASVVLLMTSLGVLFLSGVRIRYFCLIMLIAVCALAALTYLSPYRMQRLTSFLNPWEHQFGSGYQLTQSLIAFGRGGLTGVGLGESVQKLFYLPEAHTDFLFAVLAEELGLVGILCVIFLFCILVGRGFAIGRKALKENQDYNAYLAFGLSLWIGLQAMINMGVNAGLLPTKGLTLPLMSYGGSSLLIMCCVIAFLLRIDYEQKTCFY